MKRTLITILIILWAGGISLLKAQVPKQLNFIGIEEPKYDLTKAYPLIDNNGSLCGTYTVLRKSETEFKFLVKIENKKEVTIDALTELYYSPKSGRLVTLGSKLYDHVVGIVSVYIYDLEGRSISKMEDFVQFPHCAALDQEGTLWLAGKDERIISEFDLLLYRINKEGQIEHRVNLGQVTVQEIYTSKFGRTSLLIKNNNLEGGSFLRIYPLNFIGNNIDIPEISTIKGIEFLSKDEFVVCKGSEWLRYSLSESLVLLGKGRLNLNTISQYPITSLGNGFFALAHYNNSESMSGFQIDVISDRNLVVSQYLGQEILYKPGYRRIEFSGENIQFIQDDKILVFDNEF